MRIKVISIIYVSLISGLILPGCEWLHADSYCSGYHIEQLKLNETLELRYGVVYCNPENGIRVWFDSIEDSRCPLDVICIWEGNGRAKIHLEQSGIKSAFWLNTFDHFLKDTLISGLRYELIDIFPYPESNKEYSLEDYSVHLHISD